MTIGVDYEKKFREDGRLIILKALAEQANDTLASNVLQDIVLPVFGIRQNRAWVHQQMDYLANLNAIVVVDAGTIKLGTLTVTGKRHLDRDTSLDGVTRPSMKGEE